MASEGDREKVFKTITPHFFKIILDQTLHDGKLVIPKKFVRKYGDGFLDSVLLKVPSGDEWKVELFRSEGDVYLRNGWQEFVKRYSLAHGHFLVFEYTSKSCFNVLLFDTSAMEIDYPILVNVPQKPNADKKFEAKEQQEKDDNNLGIASDDSDDDVVIISDDSNTSADRKRKRSHRTFEFARPSKVQSSVSVDGSKPDEPKPKKSGPFVRNKDKITEERKSHKAAKRSWPLRKKERAKAFQRAGEYIKPGSSFFMVVMRQSYICEHLKLPYKSAKMYFKQTAGKVVLQVSDGRTWTVGYNITHSLNQAYFSSNWSVFAIDNNLKARDVCIFELIKGTEVAFRVTISKATQDINCTSPPEQSKAKVTASMGDTDTPSCSDICRDVAAAQSFTSKNPFFEVVVKTWNIEKCSVVRNGP